MLRKLHAISWQLELIIKASINSCKRIRVREPLRRARRAASRARRLVRTHRRALPRRAPLPLPGARPAARRRRAAARAKRISAGLERARAESRGVCWCGGGLGADAHSGARSADVSALLVATVRAVSSNGRLVQGDVLDVAAGARALQPAAGGAAHHVHLDLRALWRRRELGFLLVLKTCLYLSCYLHQLILLFTIS